MKSWGVIWEIRGVLVNMGDYTIEEALGESRNIIINGNNYYSMVLCSSFVLVVDERVTWEDDGVIRAVGQISYNMVLCSSFVPVVNGKMMGSYFG